MELKVSTIFCGFNTVQKMRPTGTFFFLEVEIYIGTPSPAPNIVKISLTPLRHRVKLGRTLPLIVLPPNYANFFSVFLTSTCVVLCNLQLGPGKKLHLDSGGQQQSVEVSLLPSH